MFYGVDIAISRNDFMNERNMKCMTAVIALLVGVLAAIEVDAGTGISLTAKDGSRVVARTLDWSSFPVQCGYVVTPRGYLHQSFTPAGKKGLKYKSLYGYVGIYAESESFVVEGVNEAGLSVGMFVDPDYSDCASYNMDLNAVTLCDMQFVSWLLSQFSSIDQIEDFLEDIRLVPTDVECAACWRISEPGGRTVILQFTGGRPQLYDDPSITSFHIYETGFDTVMQAFRILTASDITASVSDIPRFTSVTDQTALKFYYRTAWNCNIRCIELLSIDFSKVRYQSHPLDALQNQPIEILKVK